MTLEALIFDLDGTIADTLPIAIASFQHTFREHLGRDYTPEEVTALFGPSEEGILRAQAPDRFEAVLATYLAEYERRHACCPAPFDGLVELFDDLAGRGVRLAVVTGKGPASTAVSLRVLGLERRFATVETGSEGGFVKPDKIRGILKSWSITPANAGYVGDHPLDMQGAHEVGTLALAAAWSPTTQPETLAAEHPHQLFHTVGELAAWTRQAGD